MDAITYTASERAQQREAIKALVVGYAGLPGLDLTQLVKDIVVAFDEVDRAWAEEPPRVDPETESSKLRDPWKTTGGEVTALPPVGRMTASASHPTPAAASVGDDVDLHRRELERVGPIDPAIQVCAVEASGEDRILASVEADLALIVSRGRIVADRLIGVSEDTLRDGAQGVFLALAETLLGCSELRRRIIERISLGEELL